MRTLPRLILPIALVAATFTAQAALQPLPVHGETALASAKLLSRFHYNPLELDDRLSSQILDQYLESLDPERLFLLQSDIDEFASARRFLDDAILAQDLSVPYALFNRYTQRTRERYEFAKGLLAAGFNFEARETYRYQRKDEPWAANRAALDELWRKRVKNDWLRLKLAGQDDAAIRSTLAKRYDGALARNQRYRSEDVFEMFMNAYTGAIEPHTGYLGPRSSEDFAISMKLSLVGIGAVLQEREDYVTIRELVPGGPAARSAQLGVGDRIVSVAQGDKGTPVEVIGWRVDDVVSLIRGDKDSTVVLEVLPADAGPDGAHRHVRMVRDTITLEKQAARKSVIPVGSGESARKVGIITLPAFYQDFDGRRSGDDFRSATRDVARLIGELKAEKVDALLVDLRNNGGGSLDEAVRLTGLFIDRGPVVQQRNAQGQIRVEQDQDAGVAWDGPLGVLINRASASASEIFAAAIQDYGRGVILGAPSFGKGTVQTLVDLDAMVDSDKPRYGELKMTIAQFFRVDGGTTQLRGVSPDIPLPSLLDEDDFGESTYGNALPWSQIPPAPHAQAGEIKPLVAGLQQRHQARVARDADFRRLQEDLAEVEALRKRKEVSLNEAERRAERDRQQARNRERGPGSGDDGLLSGERSLKAELASEKSAKDAKDVLLDESARILGDLLELQQAGAGRLAAQGERKRAGR